MLVRFVSSLSVLVVVLLSMFVLRLDNSVSGSNVVRMCLWIL